MLCPTWGWKGNPDHSVILAASLTMGRFWKPLLPHFTPAGVGILLAMQSECTRRAHVKTGRLEKNDGF